jgi:hypothetical protein
MQIRCFLDEANGTTTIVLVDMPSEKVHKIASDILGVAVEKVSNLKSNGFASEPPITPQPEAKETVTSDKEVTSPKVGLNTDNLFKDTEVTVDATPASVSTPASGEVITNPIPEDNPVANTSLLKAPAKTAPINMPVDMASDENEVNEEPSTNDTPEEIPVEEFKFDFGTFRGKTIKESLESNSKKAFSYFKWLLADHILANKNPNEDAFKNDVYRQYKAYFASNKTPQENELRDVAYVLLASCDAVTRDDILSIFGYADIEEFYAANNGTNCADAIKMALA